MALNLGNYEAEAKEAIKAFWGNREAARRKQIEAGRADQGERGAVTAGKNMDGFVALVAKLVEANGLHDATYMRGKALKTLPGFFRATKEWDLLVVSDKKLVAAMELKSQVGSFGNNLNNRAEEAIGNAVDLWTAYREGAFGAETAKPFVGYLMVLEKAMESQRVVKQRSPHFPVFPEFKGASYAKRYDILCRKIVKEGLYTAAAVILTPKTSRQTGKYSEVGPLTGLKNFVAAFAAHISAEAARRA